jgi:plasmid stability protein
MANLTSKGLPRELYALLRRRAAEHRRSMNAEVLVLLEQGLPAAPVDPEALLARADAVRERVHGRPFTAAAIRRWRAKGRA